ncbi:MAG: hypothetical protein PHE67_05295 [Campylobacterales bacterium]|nr:hypothetical protein [Campylobacterales bacterium]
MEAVIESIINGQRKQAIAQIKEMNIDLEDVFEYLLNNDMSDEIIRMYKVAISVGYLTVND